MSRDVASVTIVGRAGTHPQVSIGQTGDRVSFRLVSTERRFDRATDDWVDGDEFGVTVVCWKTMASAVLSIVRKGDPVIVMGRILTRRFEKNGAIQYFTEVKADFVGLDVAKAGARFTRNPIDQRPAVMATEGVAGPDGENGDVAGSVGVDPLDRAQSDDLPAPWETDNGLRDELVSVD